MKQYNPLFEPYTFKSGVTISNKLVMAPMTTESSFENGMITTDEVLYYSRRNEDIGMVITSCAQVMENGRFAGSLGVSDDKHIPGLAKIAKAIKQNGAKAILQIFHVGRMGSVSTLKGKQPVSASAVAPVREGAETPRALSEDEVTEMIEAFGQAVRRAILAGFDGVEIHGANTYLLQQFFSPHSNRRDDQWGGTLENRMKFPLAIVELAEEMVEKYAKEPFVIGYRLSPEELENPGITLEDTKVLVNELNKTKIDYLHVSLGHYKSSSLRDKEATEPILTTIRQVLDPSIPLIGVGGVTHPDEAVDMLSVGADLVAIGKALIQEPDWGTKVKNGDLEAIRTAIDLQKIEDLVLPDKMVEYITTPKGWFNVKGQQ